MTSHGKWLFLPTGHETSAHWIHSLWKWPCIKLSSNFRHTSVGKSIFFPTGSCAEGRPLEKNIFWAVCTHMFTFFYSTKIWLPSKTFIDTVEFLVTTIFFMIYGNVMSTLALCTYHALSRSMSYKKCILFHNLISCSSESVRFW